MDLAAFLNDNRKVTTGWQESELSEPGRAARAHRTAAERTPGRVVTWKVTWPHPEARPRAGDGLGRDRYVGLADCPGAALGCLSVGGGASPGSPRVPPRSGERAPRPARWPCSRRFTSRSQSFCSYEVGRVPRAGPSSQGSCEVRGDWGRNAQCGAHLECARVGAPRPRALRAPCGCSLGGPQPRSGEAGAGAGGPTPGCWEAGARPQGRFAGQESEMGTGLPPGWRAPS